ncbi:hypothetical protein BDF19DRAFT_421962 [Syncephalis fuscata]|nr:hypothetical protein BDF19DRAFT_421962 [Syncephalis fuscata]
MVFAVDHLKRAPFYLATSLVAFTGFFLALIGAGVASAGPYVWLSVIYTFIQILAVLYCVGANVLAQYRLALLTCLAVNIMLAISNANAFIYGSSASTALVGVGFIFVALIELLWVIVIGSEDSSYIYTLVNDTISLQPTSLQSGPSAAYPMTSVNHSMPQAHTVIPMPSATMPGGVGSVLPNGAPVVPSPGAAVISNVSDIQYLYKARAKYAYTANPEDNTELSFAKEEVLDIADNKGKWWHARKADGAIGVVPSNYLELIGPANNA